MFFVVRHLECPATGGLCYGLIHRAGGEISIQDRFALDIARSPTHGLDQRAC